MADDLLYWTIPEDLIRFAHPLPRLARRLQGGASRIKIVALGSSSTAGTGDVIPYPARLEFQLRQAFPERQIDVLNRGVGGQEAPEELARMERDVIVERPDVVIWQVGTNAVWKSHDYDIEDVAANIQSGLERLKDVSTDIILMNPQYVPALIESPRLGTTKLMVRRISEAAESAGVNVFGRYELMKWWNVDDGVSLDAMVDQSDDTGLHQSDLCTRSVSRALGWAITDAVIGSESISGDEFPRNVSSTRSTLGQNEDLAVSETTLLLDDLLPTLFDATVLDATRQMLLPRERDAILTSIVNSVGECVLRRAQAIGNDAKGLPNIDAIDTFDRFSDRLMSRTEIIDGIANSSGLSRTLSELALFLMETRLDFALGSGGVSVAGIGAVSAARPDELRTTTTRLQNRLDELFYRSNVSAVRGLGALIRWQASERGERLLYEAPLLAMFRRPNPYRIALSDGLAFRMGARESEWVERPPTEENRFRRRGEPPVSPSDRTRGVLT